MALDEELEQYSTGFPAGASASAPLSLNIILGDATAGASSVWHFAKMGPFDYLFLRSRRLSVENSHDPNGCRDVLCQILLVKGVGAVEISSTPDGFYMKLPTDL